MDLIVTDSDCSTILADVTITHPNPSENQAITPSMLEPGHFSVHRENSKRYKYGLAVSIFGAKFIPLILETYGNMGAAFSAFLGKLSTELFRRQLNSDTEIKLTSKTG